jgi:hypothetical protein
VYKRKCAIRALIILSGATVSLAACSPNTSVSGHAVPQTQPSEPYRLTATIQDLMDGVVDPSADVLWDSVAYIATTKGVEDRQPRTEEEWKTVRNSAITLIEAANLLSMPGRQVAADSRPPPDSSAGQAANPAATPTGELTHAQIQQRLEASHPAFVQFARNLQDAGLKALAAIEKKDATALMEAGGQIDEACEACHVTYWYPNQSRPGN